MFIHSFIQMHAKITHIKSHTLILVSLKVIIHLNMSELQFTKSSTRHLAIWFLLIPYKEKDNFPLMLYGFSNFQIYGQLTSTFFSHKGSIASQWFFLFPVTDSPVKLFFLVANSKPIHLRYSKIWYVWFVCGREYVCVCVSDNSNTLPWVIYCCSFLFTKSKIKITNLVWFSLGQTNLL